ncbi:glycoside hydrolase family 3 protein [Candidatus Magnetobacterium bavaricum]|uniref:beta-N-acetylhexosaminidase n=1 Tax=Candidatus Magnetobacterium bavaricum TaxID=29290 RepID=A0A0F3GXQ4_9BACT|nr:glycoside hydrolase family 3 protein [Candidatus Magnetobacterium bavaricum]
MKRLNLTEKLYQLVIGRLDGSMIGSGGYREKIFGLVDKGIGGFIIFGGSSHQLKEFIVQCQGRCRTRLFFASDVERGVGQQISGATMFPCQMAVAAALRRDSEGDVMLLRQAVDAIVSECIDIGINMPLIPVLDVNRNQFNPIICTRAFSDDPHTVSWLGRLYVEAVEHAGIMCCVKHFPGHGDTAIDSHIALPIIGKTCQELYDVDLVPFAEAINRGTRGVMVGHLSVPCFDETPATLSHRIVTGLLRKKYMFDGLIITDALNMDALSKIDNVPAMCIKAGIDVLLHPLDVDATVDELSMALKNGIIEQTQIDLACKRILAVKDRLNMRPRVIINPRRHAQLSEQLTEMSITLVKGKGEIFPLPWQARLIIVGEDKLCEASPLLTYFDKCTNIKELSPPPSDLSHTAVVIAVFTSIKAWRGNSGLIQGDIDLINGIIGGCHHCVVISFGSPYVLIHFEAADILIAAYEESIHAQLSVIKCLRGEMGFTGCLPVTIKASHPG